MIKMKKEKTNQECDDKNCPIHGSLSCRGRILKGAVVSAKMHKTAKIEFERRIYIPKFERYAKKLTRVKAHNPPCINAKEGEIVKLQECRPLSKTKHFVIIEKVGLEKGFKEKMEALEEGKFKKIKKEHEGVKEAENEINKV